MKISRKRLLWIFGITLGVLGLFILALHQTLYGLAMQRYLPWEEDSFKGRPLSELKSALEIKGQDLHRVGRGENYYDGGPGLILATNQYTMKFVKGKEYNWFIVGTAINIGYVVVEKDGAGERVVNIIHRRSVDSM